MKLTTLLPFAFALVLTTSHGGQAGKESKVVSAQESPFDKGRLELQSTTGAYFSVGHSDEPSLNYSSSSYRLGIMLSTPAGDGFLRGNCELMLQLFGGSVFDGPGDYLGGAVAILRYNFVQPGARWVPYLQIGAGALYSDIYKDPAQRLIGQAWSFDLEASLGVRYFFNDRWSANLEGGYRHNSNANTNDRNIGLNSLGGGIGLGYHF